MTVRSIFGLFFLLPFVVTGYWWQRHGFPIEGEAAMYAIAFLLLGVPCGLAGAWLLFKS